MAGLNSGLRVSTATEALLRPLFREPVQLPDLRPGDAFIARSSHLRIFGGLSQITQPARRIERGERILASCRVAQLGESLLQLLDAARSTHVNSLLPQRRQRILDAYVNTWLTPLQRSTIR